MSPDLVKKKNGIFANTLYNLAGSALPLGVAVFTIPLLVRGFGKEKFGILSLAWVLIGYFSLADFGLSRTLTKFVSERIGQGKRNGLSSLIWTALSLTAAMGIVGAVLLALLSPVLVTSILKIESTNTKDVISSFYFLSIGIPFTIIATGLRGVLEALLRFDISNSVKIALGVFNFLGPALVLLFSNKILYAVVFLVMSRIICAFTYLKYCLNVLPEMRKGLIFDRSQVGLLFRFGSWITVSNIISPIMVSFDRFFLGAMVSVSALAYYSTPWEVMARILMIPSALAGVIFPVFSQMRGAKSTPSRALYSQSLKYVILIMFPFCLIGASFSKEILLIWLGNDFAIGSFRIMQIMAVAVLLNGSAMIPFSLIQASGRPDITAKFHIIEILLYIPLLWLLIREWGIIGAALAWLIRVGLDLFFLLNFSDRAIFPKLSNDLHKPERAVKYLLSIMVICIIVPAFLPNLMARAISTVLVLVIYAAISWKALLGAQEKRLIARAIGFSSD